MQGKVKWYNKQKGYGFIIADGGEEVFVHYSSVPKDVQLDQNQEVSFEVVKSDRGKQAKNVQLL